MTSRSTGGTAIKDVIEDIARWRSEGAQIALARVVATDGSSPREIGATMAVNGDGRVAGSVSGGCVESAVVETALEVIATGVAQKVTFGYSAEEAFSVGLTCGGEITIFITPDLMPFHDELEVALRARRPVAVATVIALDDPPVEAIHAADEAEDACDGTPMAPTNLAATPLGASVMVDAEGTVYGSLGHEHLDRSVVRDALGALSAGRSAVRTYGSRGEPNGVEVSVFLDAFAPPPEMVIFGAVDFTGALAKVAKVLGYVVTVCDARPTFATAERFPMADEVVVDWPHRYLAARGASLGPRDAVCVLTHDPKFDVPAICAAAATDVGYIGAMGSRRTHHDRLERLRAAGMGEVAIARVMAPIGLDIGARSPEEVAVAICAEIIAISTGRTSTFLRDGTGPIHAATPA